MYTTMNSASVHIINFVNPLQFTVHLSVLLNGSDSKFFFLLLKKSNRIILQRGGSIDIPVMFKPEKMYRHEVKVSIIANVKCDSVNTGESAKHNLHWEYPIFGQPELRLSSNEDAPKLMCRAKQQCEQMVEVTLVKSLKSSADIYFRRPGKG